MSNNFPSAMALLVRVVIVATIVTACILSSILWLAMDIPFTTAFTTVPLMLVIAGLVWWMYAKLG